MPTCPYPGPPCYTLKSQSSGSGLGLQSNAIPISNKVTDIAWKRKYFNNPIVSSVKIEVVIWDVNKSTPLAKFKQVAAKEPKQTNELLKPEEAYQTKPIEDNLYYYELDRLDSIKKGMIVLYYFKEEKGDEYEFRIQVI